jgi:hypothetical protein
LAKQFFSNELPYWDMQPCESEAYCLAKLGDLYAVYLSTDTPGLSRADIAAGDYSLHSFDPVTGQMRAPKIITIQPDVPLSRALQASDADQVVLLRRMKKK